MCSRIFVAGFFFLSASLTAAPNPQDFKERQAREVQRIGEQIQSLTELKGCIEQAQKDEAVQDCRKQRRDKRRAAFEARKKEREALKAQTKDAKAADKPSEPAKK